MSALLGDGDGVVVGNPYVLEKRKGSWDAGKEWQRSWWRRGVSCGFVMSSGVWARSPAFEFGHVEGCRLVAQNVCTGFHFAAAGNGFSDVESVENFKASGLRVTRVKFILGVGDELGIRV